MKSATVSLQSAQSNPMTFAPLIRADTFPSSPDHDLIIELHPIRDTPFEAEKLSKTVLQER